MTTFWSQLRWRSRLAASSQQEFSPGLQFVLFGAVGVLNTLVDIVAFWIMVTVGTSALIAHPVSFALGSANSLLLNQLITFRGRQPRLTLRIAARFMLTAACTLGISQAVLVAALHAERSVMEGKLAATLATLVAGFWINRTFTFRRSALPGAPP